MEKIEFTKAELEFLEEMIDFPKVYRLSDYGLETAKSLHDKIKKIVNKLP